MSMNVCIFGKNGKIGNMFYLYFIEFLDKANIFTPTYNIDYNENYFIDIEKYLHCNIFIFANHNLNNPNNYYNIIMNILDKIPNNNNTILVNISSDAEIIKIPKRYTYENIKKKIRLYLETRNNRVINIFMPYINNKNYEIIKNKIFNMDWKYDYYYFSVISNIYRPCLTNIKYTQKY